MFTEIILKTKEIDIFAIHCCPVKKIKEENTQKMIEKGWEFEIDAHQIRIPTDIKVDPYQVDAIQINNGNRKEFAITNEEFRQFFDRFCYDSITRLIKEK